MNHGGKRAGAGRPAHKRKKKVLSVRVFEDIIDELDKEEDKPKAVNEILEKHYKLNNPV